MRKRILVKKRSLVQCCSPVNRKALWRAIILAAFWMNRWGALHEETHFHTFESVWSHFWSPLRQLFIKVTAQSQQPLYQKPGAVWTIWGIIIATDCKSLHPHNKLIWLIIRKRRGETSFYSLIPGKTSIGVQSLWRFGKFKGYCIKLHLWLKHICEGEKSFFQRKSGIRHGLDWHISWDFFSENVFRLQLFSKGKCDVSGKHPKRKKSS